MRLRYVPPLLLALASAAVAAVPSDEFPPPIPKSDAPAVVRTGVRDGDVIDVPAGKYADLSIDVPAGSSVVTRYSPQPTQASEGLAEGRFILIGTGPVVVMNTLFAVDVDPKTNKPVVKTTRLDFTVQFAAKPDPDPTPPAPPGPGPNPPTPPTPGGQVAFFVVAEDTSKAGPWRGAVLGSPKVESFYRQLRGSRTGAIHRLIDVNGDTTDPVAAWAVKAAAGKTLPYLWMLDASGKVVKELACPTDPDAFVAAFNLHADEPRKFGLIPAKKKLKWTEFGSTPNTPLIPRDQWKATTLQTFLGPVHDQDGRGQCVASAFCSVMEACRAQAGLPYVYLSAGDLYSNINGGRDNGAILEDAMAWGMKNGVATVASVPYVWNGRRATSAAVVAERKNYVAVEVYLCPSFDAAASAIQQGFHIEEALTWYNSYSPGKDGWLPPPSRGVAGGHALHGYGLRQRNGVWGIETKNSWNTSWGGSTDGTVPAGCCVIPEANFDDVASNGFFAIRAVVQTPTQFPTPSTLRLDPFRRGERGLAMAP
jgi:hypothetical protein